MVTSRAATSDAMKGATVAEPWKPRCPLCSRRTALVGGKLARHKDGTDWCLASRRTTLEATVLLAQKMARGGAK